jgi:hypothetical protein
MSRSNPMHHDNSLASIARHRQHPGAIQNRRAFVARTNRRISAGLDVLAALALGLGLSGILVAFIDKATTL